MSGKAKYMLVQYLTVARVPLAILAAVLLQFAVPERPLAYVVVAVLIVCELTDIFDGLVARRLGMSSRFGSLFDPYCDSVSRLIIFFGLAMRLGDWRPGLQLHWLVLLMALRDISVAYIRIMCILSNRPVQARFSGKTKAWVQGLGAILLAALYAATPRVADWVPWAIAGLVAGVTVWSLVDYFGAALESRRSADPEPAGRSES